MGKAVARKKNRTVAVEALGDEETKKYIISLIGKATICSDLTDSVLRSENSDALKEFTWEALLQELRKYFPTLISILFSATKTRTPRNNQESIVGLCASILIKQRNAKLSLVQKLISLILYAGHSSKEVVTVFILIQNYPVYFIGASTTPAA